MFKHSLVLLFCLLLAKFSFSIGDDSTYHRFDPNWTKYRTWNVSYMRTIDTGLTLFQRYNPAMYDYYMRSTGNLGYPAYRLIPQVFDELGLKLGITAYDVYYYRPEEVKFYKTRKPYSNLQYLMGSGNEQMFSGLHTQNISKDYNVGFAFRRIGSDGIYKNMRSDYVNLLVHQSYQTNDDRYHIDFCAFRNKSSVRFNGGITISIDSVYSNPAFITKKIVPVRLDSARYSYTENTICFRQYVQFGKRWKQKVQDTLSKDVLDVTSRIHHRFTYSNVNHLFYDVKQDFNYYPQVIKNSDKTSDSIGYQMMQNEIRWELTDTKTRLIDTVPRSRPYQLTVYARHRYYHFRSNIFDNVQNLNAGLEFARTTSSQTDQSFKNYLKRSFLYASGEYSFVDYNKGEYLISGYVGNKLLGSTIYLMFQETRQMPTIIQQRFSGNHYQWENDFSAVTSRRVSIYYSMLKSSIRLRYFYLNINNPIYFDTQAQPAQLRGNLIGSAFAMDLKLRISKMHLDNSLTWQYYSNTIFSYPNFFSVHSVYYANYLFKSALQLQVGLDLFNNGNFQPYQFNINTSQFYLQNAVAARRYLWTDAFVNMKIKAVRIAIKSDNVLQGLLGSGADLIPAWPLPDRSFKLIVNWMFWN